MPESAHDSGRSAMGRASDALPFKPYVYRGGGEPPAVTAARERWRAAHAAVAETAAPGDDDIGYEWRREQLEELADAGLAEPRPAPEPVAVAEPPAPCQRCGQLETELDALRTEVQALRVLAAETPAPPPPVRCKKCGYLTTTTGHKVMCDA